MDGTTKHKKHSQYLYQVVKYFILSAYVVFIRGSIFQSWFERIDIWFEYLCKIEKEGIEHIKKCKNLKNKKS